MIGKNDSGAWHEQSVERQQGIVEGVAKVLDGSIKTPEDAHASWIARMRADGWSYGPKKDAQLKLHPCIVHYKDLRHEDRVQDRLFLDTIQALQWAVWGDGTILADPGAEICNG